MGGYAAFSALGCRSRESVPVAPDAAPEAGSSALVTFTESTFLTLSAICERLLPRDQDPGAVDLGVPVYIDRALATPELSSIREVVRRVLPLVDRQARTRFDGKAFHEATGEQQDEILDLWQRGHDGGQHFFPVILSLTLEGAFGDPKYGGNAAGRGFAMIGFTPDPPLHKMSSGHAMPPGTP
jgi:gluconate 2-dehydrogenase gamma chain